jgi:FHA domain
VIPWRLIRIEFRDGRKALGVVRDSFLIGLPCRFVRRCAGRNRSRFSAGLLLLTALVVGALFPVQAVAAPQLMIEPGLPVDGQWLLPIGIMDETGAPVEFIAGDVRLQMADAPVTDFTLRPLSPAVGGEPVALAVLLGSRGLPPVASEVLAGYLKNAGPGAARGLYLIDGGLKTAQSFGSTPADQAQIDALTPGRQPSRLWDGVLAVLEKLASHQPAVRRTLVILADGAEDLPSEHTLATCVDAALRARVAVHAVILPGDEAGAARLSDLANRTGGHSSDFLAAANLRRFLRAIDSYKVLQIPAGGDDSSGTGYPVEIKVEVALSGGLTGTGRIARPEALSGPNPVLIGVLALAAVIVLTGGFLLFWAHRRKAGILQVRIDGRVEEHAIPRSGLTLGTKADSQLVLADRRVSGHHAVIRARGSEVILTDLRSTNGTKVNDVPIRTAHLREGDRILLGDAVEMFFLKDQGRKRK